MEKINKIFYINLDRAPERKEHFLNQCIIHNIPSEKIERFDAIDGLMYEFKKNELSMFRRADFLLNPENILKKIIGNQLSHYYVLKNIIKNKHQYSIICQDDVKFKPGFIEHIDNIMNHFPENAELINIGLHEFAEGSDFVEWNFNNGNDDEKVCKILINDYVSIWNDNLNPCSLAYIVSLEGAKKIVTHFEMFGFRKTTDYNFIDYLINNNIFYGSNCVLATTNTEFESDIFF